MVNKRDTADDLAKAHFRVDPRLRRVILLYPLNEENPNEPIRLLEVVEGTIELGIEPVAFTADPENGIEYPSVIVEVSPAEYELIREGKIDELGARGWSLGPELLAG
jgi:hypothetical protein